MFKYFYILLVYLVRTESKAIYITFNRNACKLDQSDCNGSPQRPFSNPILAFKFALFMENIEKTGILEFYFEAGGHTVLPVDFLGAGAQGYRKSIFENYEGKFENEGGTINIIFSLFFFF